jgi:clan AA aspartic protease (TIGR02281 family)
MLLLSIGNFIIGRGYLSIGEQTPARYKEKAIKCIQSRDLSCAENNLTSYLRTTPNDTVALANLGIVQNQLEEHQEAIKQFEKAISLGEGTYDLFAYYADSLAKIGRTDDAINWSYKTLAVTPRLVDVRENLAKLLISKNRHYEALSLLEFFDASQESNGRPAYFGAQRIAIEEALKEGNPESRAIKKGNLRIPNLSGHFYVPLQIGEAKLTSFMVDTGASKLTLSESMLEQSKVKYSLVKNDALVKTADGRQVKANIISIESLMVGPFQLKNISAFVCKSCSFLLGQSVLAAFDMQSSKTQGVEFLTLALRP